MRVCIQSQPPSSSVSKLILHILDANVEYRNLDDAINKELCGSGCGVCPSGTSDTRCSVGINDYLDLFAESDYWISAGIGANCWSASCNFELDSDTLLGQNPGKQDYIDQ